MNTQSNLFNLSATDFKTIRSHNIAEDRNDFDCIILDICLPIIDSIVMNCEIEPHTDKVVHHTEKYADNWVSCVDASYNVKFIQVQLYSYRNPQGTWLNPCAPRYVWAINRMKEIHNERRRVSENYIAPEVDLFDDIDDLSSDQVSGDGNETHRYEYAVSQYKKYLKRLHDETRSIRIRYMYQVAVFFDSPIGQYMVHTHHDCYRRFIDRFQDITLNRNKCNEGERKMIDAIDELLSRIEFNNIYRVQWTNGAFTNPAKMTSDEELLAFLDNYNDFMMEFYAKYLVSSSRNPYQYTFQFYLFLNTPTGIYWSERYPDNYRLIKNSIREVIDEFIDTPCEKLYTFSNETNVKDDTAIIIRDLECLPYQTQSNMKKIKYLQSFCQRNNQYFRFSHWIHSREFNEWFYAPNGIGGKMHMLHMGNQLDSELNSKWYRMRDD
jgi:hypothetical protein